MKSDWPKHAKLIKSKFSNTRKYLKYKNTCIMKIVITVLLLPFCVVSVGNAYEWKLVWSDEFNYEGQPDSGKWQYEKGLVRNDETAYYTNRPKNVRVEGGVLVIEAHKESYTDGSVTADYTSGSIETENRKNFKYGRLEVRAKMPYGSGSHTGIWFSGANISEIGWPGCGELDVAEYVGRLPHTIHSVNHYACPANKTEHCKTYVGQFTVMNPYDNFHIYGVEWDEQQIKYFIDNTHVATFNVDDAGTGSDNPFREEFVFHLNYSLGGWGWEVDDSTMPQKFEIDYVRFYEKYLPTEAKTGAAVNSLLLRK